MKKKINMDIKSCLPIKNQRWMRCINTDDLDDYVDIRIQNGSSSDAREAVLKSGDLLGGKWSSVFDDSPKVEYDYYYLYRRDENNNYDVKLQDSTDGSGDIHIGQHRDGDFVRVDRKTNKIIEKRCMYELNGKCSKPFAQKANS